MKPDSLPIFDQVKAASQLPKDLPFLRLGFRPFYLGGALLAALIVPLWVALFLGAVPLATNVPPLLWHAHEMLFGFAVAIIVGFLMTAGKAWTGLATPRGPLLAALALLWLAARLASVLGPYSLYAVLDVALLPLVAAILVTLFLRARNFRNLPMGLILALLASANLVFHLAASGVLNVSALTPLYAALALIVMIECVIAGRVVPMFTMTVTPGLKLTSKPWIERVTLGVTALGLALWVFAPPGAVGMFVLALASGLHLKRLAGWRPMVTRGRPVLWILHAAYAWIAAGLWLLALAQIGIVPVSAGVHALAVGATGGLIIGMITRTARGHTGRPIQASAPEVWAYGLVMGAAVFRVLVPLAVPSLYTTALVVAGAAWSVAFLIYLWIFTPWLMQTRLDGKDG
ncbi:MAG: NnrS family protein [Pseudomonadota bacterium]